VSQIVWVAPPAGDDAGVVDRCGNGALIVQRSGTKRVDTREFARESTLEAARSAARRRVEISTDERAEIIEGTDGRGDAARYQERYERSVRVAQEAVRFSIRLSDVEAGDGSLDIDTGRLGPGSSAG
jgi:hypothetical protein